MNYWAVLERPGDAGAWQRARFFRAAFGGTRVPLVGLDPVVLRMPGERKARLRYRGAVFSSPELELMFETECLMRPGGPGVLAVVRRRGFYPVNVDGIIVVASEPPIFTA